MTEPVTPVVRQKCCPSCGTAFDCCAGGCWCDDVPLSGEMRTALRERFADCLCPAWLRTVGQSRATSSGLLASLPSTSSSAG
jgi:hypothetical protein